jgi:hypothetical protein
MLVASVNRAGSELVEKSAEHNVENSRLTRIHRIHTSGFSAMKSGASRETVNGLRTEFSAMAGSRSGDAEVDCKVVDIISRSFLDDVRLLTSSRVLFRMTTKIQY